MEISGDENAIFQGTDLTYSAKEGVIGTDKWVGTKQAINNLVPSVANDYDSLQVTKSDPVHYQLAAQWVQETVNAWELLGGGLTENMTSHPAFTNLAVRAKNALLDVKDNNGKVSQRFLDLYTDFSALTVDKPWTVATIQGLSGVTAPMNEAIEFFYDDFNKGQTTFQASQWVLRNTTLVANRRQLSVNMSGIERIWLSDDLPNTIPTGVRDAIDEIVVPEVVATGYTWGWLKQTPTVTQSQGGRVTLAQEWWGYIWPHIIYPVYEP